MQTNIHVILRLYDVIKSLKYTFTSLHTGIKTTERHRILGFEGQIPTNAQDFSN